MAGSRNTPLTLWPSGATPAAMPLAKAIGPAPRDCTLHEKHYKKAPAMRMHSGCLEGLCGGCSVGGAHVHSQVSVVLHNSLHGLLQAAGDLV